MWVVSCLGLLWKSIMTAVSWAPSTSPQESITGRLMWPRRRPGSWECAAIQWNRHSLSISLHTVGTFTLDINLKVDSGWLGCITNTNTEPMRTLRHPCFSPWLCPLVVWVCSWTMKLALSPFTILQTMAFPSILSLSITFLLPFVHILIRVTVWSPWPYVVQALEHLFSPLAADALFNLISPFWLLYVFFFFSFTQC